MNHACTALRISLNAIVISLLAVNGALLAQEAGDTSNEAVNMPEVRLMNIRSILSNWGFSGGIFDQTSNIIQETIPRPIRKEFYGIEGNNLLIDTPEEFVTAAFFSPIQISTIAKANIDKELPQGKDGALRLASMWMKKSVDFPELKANCQKAINMIAEKSNLSNEQITTHYNNSITNTINDLGNKYLSAYASPGEIQTIVSPVKSYYLSGDGNTDSILSMAQTLFKTNANRFGGMMAVIGELNKNLGYKISNIVQGYETDSLNP